MRRANDDDGRRRRARPTATVLASLVLAAGAVVTAPVPASAAPVTAPVAAPVAAPVPEHYVALGDSFSSGVGTGDYDLAGSPCLRSSEAYAPEWAAQHGTGDLTFLACSGAKISDVLRKQVPNLPRDAEFITVTMGGNDTGFSSVLSTCTLATSDDTCRAAVRVGKVAAVTTVPVQLAATLAVIRHRAPHATVVVLGYPRLFELGPCAGAVPGESRRRQINSGADLLDTTLSKVSRASGARFVDVRARFAGHGVCAPEGQAWINGPGRGTDSYHPTATGYEEGYLSALTALTG